MYDDGFPKMDLVEKLHTLQMAIGNRIMDIMIEKKINEEELARRLNIPSKEVYRMVAGVNSLQLIDIARLSLVLGEDIITVTK